MTSPNPANHNGPALAFLVERYLTPAAADDLAASTARLAGLCAGSDHTDTSVEYLYSAYLPSEDTCFCLFRAASPDAVRAVNNQARFALDRVTDAALLVCVETQARPNPNSSATSHRRPR